LGGVAGIGNKKRKTTCRRKNEDNSPTFTPQNPTTAQRPGVNGNLPDKRRKEGFHKGGEKKKGLKTGKTGHAHGEENRVICTDLALDIQNCVLSKESEGGTRSAQKGVGGAGENR